ncbi:MAG TPA: type II toxin-antitoxin system Phd/YefM family antitoxin [Thermotogales bacterium]|nr:type II toxin-antitoxin system Phd/YefM family antitoxin [Thermotogales bacterium]
MTIIMVRFGGINLKLRDLKFYSVANAKRDFTKILKETKDEDIVITRNGKPFAVMISFPKYVKMMDFLSRTFELYLMDVGEEGFPEIHDLEKILIDIDQAGGES